MKDYSDLVKQADLERLRPYGDRMDDGVMQISFTLPVPVSPEAREAAVQLCRTMGLDDIKVGTMESAADGFSFFVIYARSRHTVDFKAIKVLKVDSPTLGMEEIDDLVDRHFGRKLVVLGACTGYDAHTVGIDAIFNMKGFAGDYGLERYKSLDARNLGAQVLNADLLRMAAEANADAVLVSKVVTQHDIHLRDLKELMELADRLKLRDKLLFIAGGPRITHPLALECGFDAGFGTGTRPSEVASYIVHELIRKSGEARDE
jgi:beta-lysine 5,6-aminomutase beta subunit